MSGQTCFLAASQVRHRGGAHRFECLNNIIRIRTPVDLVSAVFSQLSTTIRTPYTATLRSHQARVATMKLHSVLAFLAASPSLVAALRHTTSSQCYTSLSSKSTKRVPTTTKSYKYTTTVTATRRINPTTTVTPAPTTSTTTVTSTTTETNYIPIITVFSHALNSLRSSSSKN